jgi:alanine-glyoxylate transaminase/serine-glyoxylate transaminase/serine-pyruvate transaminase
VSDSKTPLTFFAFQFSISFSDKIATRKSLVKSYNYDAIQLGEYWNCFDGRPRIYHHTICSTLLYGLREAIAIFIENGGGLEAAWKRHRSVANHFHSLLEANGLELFISGAENRCPSVTSIKAPENIDGVKVIGYAMKKYNVEIGGGLGPTVGKIFR